MSDMKKGFSDRNTEAAVARGDILPDFDKDGGFEVFKAEGAEPARLSLEEERERIRREDEATAKANEEARRVREERIEKNRVDAAQQNHARAVQHDEKMREEMEKRTSSLNESIAMSKKFMDKQLRAIQKETVLNLTPKKRLALRIEEETLALQMKHSEELQDTPPREAGEVRQRHKVEANALKLEHVRLKQAPSGPPLDPASQKAVEDHETRVAKYKLDAWMDGPQFFPQFAPGATPVLVDSTPPAVTGGDFEDIEF